MRWPIRNLLLPTTMMLAVASSSEVNAGGLYGSNLLSNPSFEDYYTDDPSEYVEGDFTIQWPLQTDQSTSRGVQGWENAGFDVCSIRTDGAGSGATGDYYGMGGRYSEAFGEISRMRQDIDLLACGYLESELDGGSLRLSGGAWLSSYPDDADSVGFSIGFLDQKSLLLAVALDSGQQNHDEWTPYVVEEMTIPAGTRFIRFDTEFVKVEGDNSDGRIDDAWVTITPSSPPAAMLDRNLLANPMFEAGAGGWLVTAGNVRARMANINGVPAHSGAFLLFGGQHLGANPSVAGALQTIELVDYGFAPQLLDDLKAGLYIRAEGWLYSWDSSGQAKFTVGIFDQDNQLLLSYDSGRVKSHITPAPRRFEAPLPAGARTIVYTYDSLDPYGANLDGYFDDALLVVTATQHEGVSCGPVAIGHRGNSMIAPENTVASIERVLDEAQLVEFDVRECLTGELVVIHDQTVDRTTNGTGLVEELSLAELLQLDAGSWFSPDFVGEPIPTMEDALSAMPRGATPLIERKSGSASKYVEVLQDLAIADQVIVLSLNWDFLANVHRLDDQIVLAAVGIGPLTRDELEVITASGASIVMWRGIDIGPAEVALVQGAGLQLFVWTINEWDSIASFIAMDVDGIVSENPGEVTWQAPPGQLVGDLDADGSVGANDLLILLGSWGPCPDCNDCPADLDGSCIVGAVDLLILLANWGSCF